MQKSDRSVTKIMKDIFALGLCGASLTMAGCAVDEDTADSVSEKLEAMPMIAVTSPTATSSSALASQKALKKMDLMAQVYHFFDRSIDFAVAGVTSEDGPAAAEEMKADLTAGLEEGDAEALAEMVGTMSVESQNAECYGASWTDNARGSSVSRPGGDTGIVYATASNTDTKACAAAQLEALMRGGPHFANKIIALQGALLASIKDGAIEDLDEGDDIDVLDDLPEVEGLTFTKATLTRESDYSGGFKTYHSEFEFTDENSKTGTVNVYHTDMGESEVDDSKRNFAGLIQAVLPHSATMGGTGTRRGLSMVYSSEDGVDSFALDSAADRDSQTTDYFDSTTGRLSFANASFATSNAKGEDGHKIIASFSDITGEATMHYAWQAGGQDNAVRTFAITIDDGDVGEKTGVAYFGFGAAMQSLTDDTSTLWATKMYCDWLQGTSNGTSQANLVQAQTFAQDGDEIFKPVTNKIAYAPNPSCQAASYTVTNANATYLNQTYNVPTHSLVAPQSQGTVPAVSAPEYDYSK